MSRIRRGLISVSDKTGLAPFAKGLSELGIEILSTGGTASFLKKAGIDLVDVSTYTGFPEMLDGRVKTLHPKIHAGLLARRDLPSHCAALEAFEIKPLDLLVVSLYPFEKTLDTGASFEEMIEQIDIGGPAMIRSAAKNHQDVVVLVDPDDYPSVMTELVETGGQVSLETRKALAAKAFLRTAAYDAMIGQWFWSQTADAATELPPFFAVGGLKKEGLRYGENPHQRAALYRTADVRRGVSSARQRQGKALSYNNLNDTDAAFECVAEFSPQESAACAIIKHANPCGVALGETVLDAYEAALAADPVSAFGGIIALNQEVDALCAQKILEVFTEVVIAPSFSPDALEIFSQKKNVRVLETGGLPTGEGVVVKSVAGGLLVQDRDLYRIELGALEVVTKRHPTPQEWDDLLFAMRVVKHVKSNAIVYACQGRTVGIGAGQMSRVLSCELAGRSLVTTSELLSSNVLRHQGSFVAASDAFFPFADGLEVAIKAGVRAIIQPGGSVRDQEVIASANASEIAMVFTGVRHFRH